MTARFVEIRYTDAVERVPLHDVDELRRILDERGSFVSYSIHSSLLYGLVPWRKKRVRYVQQPPRNTFHT
jgi:hypothetical protein